MADITPDRVVEITPERLLEAVPAAVAEIVPVLVAEIVPVFVAEMVPPFARAVLEIAKTKMPDNTITLTFFIVLLLVTGNVRG